MNEHPHSFSQPGPRQRAPTVLEAQPEGSLGGGVQRIRRPGWSEAEAW